MLPVQTTSDAVQFSHAFMDRWAMSDGQKRAITHLAETAAGQTEVEFIWFQDSFVICLTGKSLEECNKADGRRTYGTVNQLLNS